MHTRKQFTIERQFGKVGPSIFISFRFNNFHSGLPARFISGGTVASQVNKILFFAEGNSTFVKS